MLELIAMLPRSVAIALSAAAVAVAQGVGADLYKRNCAPCHGPGGEGGKGPSLFQLTRGSDSGSIATIIANGIPGAAMPTYNFQPDQLRALAEWVRRFSADRSDSNRALVPRGSALVRDKGGCLRCHMVAGEGGVTGPDLSRVGANRSLDQLRDTLLDPAGKAIDRYSMFHWQIPIKNDHVWIKATLASGAVVEGSRMNEDPFTIQVRDAEGRLHSLDKSDAAKIERRPGKTLMPSFRDVFNDEELTAVVAYLSSLRGKP
jgi:putative heme-binding domain-containing protein